MAKLNIGYCRRPLWTQPGTPLAGHVTLRERIAETVHDPLYVTALVLSEGERRVAVVAADLLVSEDRMVESLENRLASHGISGLYFNASHTHSAVGCFVDSPGARFFMGRYRPDVRQTLEDRIVETVLEASEELSAVKGIRYGQAEIRGMTMNRRLADGPVDDTVHSIEFRLSDAPSVLVVCNSGHPVIASCTQLHAMSADYPGRVTARVESLGWRCLYLSGALGGLNILFPEMALGLERHLDLVTGLVTGGVLESLKMQRSLGVPSLSFQKSFIEGRRQFPPTAVHRGAMKRSATAVLASTVGALYSRGTAPSTLKIPVTVVKLGPIALVGMPADFGVLAALTLKAAALERRVQAVVNSHTNGYAGYVHLPEEYDWQPDARNEFVIYESAMSWYGNDLGARLNQAALQMLGN